jgi:hypothetical protein
MIFYKVNTSEFIHSLFLIWEGGEPSKNWLLKNYIDYK